MFPDLRARAKERPGAPDPESEAAALYSPHGARALRGAGRLCSQLITEQADVSLTRGAEVKGHCGHDESELQVFWVDRAYALKMLFVTVTVSEAGGARADSGCGWVGAAPLPPGSSPLTRASSARQESHNTSKGPEATWKLSKVQFVYDSSEKTHFKDAVSGE